MRSCRRRSERFAGAHVNRSGALLRRRRERGGLSLLEVMLALAILGGALAVIGELTRLGARSAESARDLTTAQRLCENKMAEVSTGLLLPQAIVRAPLEELQGQPDEYDWMYTVEIEQLPQMGLIGIWLTVEQSPERFTRPVSFTLTRWMIDPQTMALQSGISGTSASGTASGLNAAGGSTSSGTGR